MDNQQGFTREDAAMEERDTMKDWEIILKTMIRQSTEELCRDGFPVD